MTICVTQVKINYNMQDYLPEGANSPKAIEIMQENFNDSIANTNVLIMDVTIDEAIKQEVSNTLGITSEIDLTEGRKVKADKLIEELTEAVHSRYESKEKLRYEIML